MSQVVPRGPAWHANRQLVWLAACHSEMRYSVFDLVRSLRVYLSLSLHSTYILSILTHLLTPSLTTSIRTPSNKSHKNDDHPTHHQSTTSNPPTSPAHTSNVPTQAFPPFPILLFFLTFFRLLLRQQQQPWGSSTEKGLHSGFEYVTCS